MELSALLDRMTETQATDLHLAAGFPPTLRIRSELVTEDQPALDGAGLTALLGPILTGEQRAEVLEARKPLTITVQHGANLLLCHLFREQDHLAAAIRMVPSHVPTLSDLELPPIIDSLTHSPRGLILVVGATGSGKTTTAAAMLQQINLDRAERIFTVEDPIEYVLASEKSLVTQHAVGRDVDSLEDGIASVSKCDLDVALVNPLRTAEQVRLTLQLAETGHLVFATLHADTVSEGVQRVLELCPEPRDAVRRMLSRNLVAVIAQKLLRRADRPGRVAADEILLATPRVRQIIAEGRSDLTVAIEAGRDMGMQTMDDAVLKHSQSGTIDYQTAWENMEDRARLGAVPGEESV